MTISAYISRVLSGYEGIEIDTNHMDAGSDRYGLYKSPGRDCTEHIDGTQEITEHFQFFARQSSVSASERKEADEWLEDLTYWVDEYGYQSGFPELDARREVIGLSITGAPYAMSVDDDEMLYQMSISITYLKEREGY